MEPLGGARGRGETSGRCAVTYYPLYLALGRYAEPGSVNYPMAILVVAILVSYEGMVYGPIAAFLAEYFPARIRYPETRKISIWRD